MISAQLRNRLWLRISPWLAFLMALLGVVCYGVQAISIAHDVLPYMDEGTYLYKGYLFATGVYRPFQDNGVWTNKMPFSFLIPGWAQVMFGPGMRTGRYFAIFLAIVTLVGLFLIGRRFAGLWGGTALIWLVASNQVFIKYFSMGISQVLVFFLLVWVMYFITFNRSKILPLIISGLLAGVLVTTRENMVLVIPIFAGYILWDKGWRAALWFFGNFLIVFIIVHVLYWPNIMQLWNVWLPWISRWIFKGEIAGTTNTAGLGTPFWFPQMDAASRWMSFWEGTRQMLVPLVLSIGSLLYWMHSPQRKKREKFKFVLALFLALILLWAAHAWASLGNNYCVFCYSPYISFFTILGLILGVITLADWTSKIPSRFQVILVATTCLILISSFYFSLSGNVWLQIMKAEVPKMNGLHLEGGTIQIWRLISNKFHIDYSLLLEDYKNIYGNLKISAGIVICILIFITSCIWMTLRKKIYNKPSFGKAFLITAIVFISGINLIINWNEISMNNRACGDIIAETENAGKVLAQYVTPGQKIYWEGGNSPLPLIYLSQIKIFPAQLNGDNSKRVGGDENELQRVGFWNETLAAKWKSEADILFVAQNHYEGTVYNWINPLVAETPPVYACLPESKIFVLKNR